MDNFILISGCSCGGKSTLLHALAGMGYRTVEEPGRRIVEAGLASGGAALPWADPEAFLRRALDLALADYEAALGQEGYVFFDRGLVDALVALQHLTGQDALAHPAARLRYAPTVFLAPPWPEIFVTDSARRHGLEDAMAEYDRLLAAFPALGYRPVLLPKVPVSERAAYLLSAVSGSAGRLS